MEAITIPETLQQIPNRMGFGTANEQAQYSVVDASAYSNWMKTKEHKLGNCSSSSQSRILCFANRAIVQDFFQECGWRGSTLRTPWSNCYRTATASELIWLRRNVTGGRGAFQTYTKERTLPIRIWPITDAVLSCWLADSDVIDQGAD